MVADTSVIMFASLGIVIALGLGWVVGRIMDLQWRTKQLRSILKRDYGMMVIFNKDNRTIKSTMVDFGKDEIKIKDERWIVENRHIYRADKREKGFFANEANLKWEEGVPMVFVDHDHLKPVEFTPPDGTTKPVEISAWLNAWVANQMAKRSHMTEQLKWLVIITLVVAMAAAAIGYLTYTGLGGVKDVCAGAHNVTAIATPVGGGTLINPTPTPIGGH